MSEREFSLRDRTLEGLQLVFAQLLATLNDTPSKPVVMRKLTEAFHHESGAIGELCDTMEGRLRAHRESRLAALKEAVDMFADRCREGMKQQRNFSFFEKEFDQFKQAQTTGLRESVQQHATFIEEWRLDLERETIAIVNKFHDEAVRIMAEGVLADDATEYLDTDRSPRH